MNREKDTKKRRINTNKGKIKNERGWKVREGNEKEEDKIGVR